MERRKPKKKDQLQIEKAFNLLTDCIAEHPEIEPTLWAAAFWSILVDGYIASSISYEQFTREWDEIKHLYKSWFDK